MHLLRANIPFHLYTIYFSVLLKITLPVRHMKIVYGKDTDVQRKAFLQQDDNISSILEVSSKYRKTISSSQVNSPTDRFKQYHWMKLKHSLLSCNGGPYGIYIREVVGLTSGWPSIVLHTLDAVVFTQSLDTHCVIPLMHMYQTLCMWRAHLCALSPCTRYLFFSNKVRVVPCLLSSNKSRPHLYTYVDLIKGRKRVVLVCESSWIWPRVAKHEAFSSTRGANGLQFSLKVGVHVLPLENLEIGWICQGCRYQVRNRHRFELLVSYDVKPQIMDSNKYKLLSSSDQLLDKLVQLHIVYANQPFGSAQGLLDNIATLISDWFPC